MIDLIVDTETNTVGLGIFVDTEPYVATSSQFKSQCYIGWAGNISTATYIGTDEFNGISLFKIDKPVKTENALGHIQVDSFTEWSAFVDVEGVKVLLTRPSISNVIDGSPVLSSKGIIIGMIVNFKKLSLSDVMESVNRIRYRKPVVSIGVELKEFGLLESALYSGGMVENGGLIVVKVPAGSPFTPGSIIVSPIKNGRIDYGNLKPGDSMELTFYGGTKLTIVLNSAEPNEDEIVSTPCYQNIYMKTLKTRADLKKK